MPLTSYVSGLVIQTVPIGVQMITKVDRFTATDASYVVPAGVTYMIAYIRGGGGGVAGGGAGTGGTSSVAFAGGTVSATGGLGYNGGNFGPENPRSATVNSGKGAIATGNFANVLGAQLRGLEGALITAGSAVTEGATVAVTVGAGGTGTGVGGSGYVYLEYQVKA